MFIKMHVWENAVCHFRIVNRMCFHAASRLGARKALEADQSLYPESPSQKPREMNHSPLQEPLCQTVWVEKRINAMPKEGESCD